jgi:hypothetical protein
MADTRTQIEVEDWVRQHWMPAKFGQKFHRERLQLSSGGVFDFDAVSSDRKIAASISTSAATTAGGKNAVGKLMKLRADMLFLLLAQVERRLIVLTEPDMYEQCLKEVQGGRVPPSIEFFHAEIPDELKIRLRKARRIASREVSPHQGD